MRGHATDNSARSGKKTLSFTLRWSLLLVTLSLLALTISQGRVAGAELERLPPVRLPLAGSSAWTARVAATADEMDDLVRLAGGAVELRVRQGWWIWEVPIGREVRVALSPTRPKSLTEVPDSGYWVCFHVRSLTGSADPKNQLADQMRQRLVEISGGRAEPVSSLQFQRLGRWDAVEQEFSLPAASGATAMHGSHVLVHTRWGLFEFHSRFPADRYQQQLGETTRLLQHVKLAAPTVAEIGPTTAQTIAAATIHGSWKAFRSRLRLSSNGGIEISTDRAQVISPPSLEVPQPFAADVLQGRYRADGDLLFVQWQDGSKLNFRWKLNGDDLLLTDHDGQISQLRRLAE